jgi:hypothetical protein
MNETRVVPTEAKSKRRRHFKLLTALSMGIGFSMLISPASSQSIGDRFKSLLGVQSEPAPSGPPRPEESELTCPPVSIRAGASTYAVGLPNKPAVGSDLRFQATITRTARSCSVNGGEITAKIGIEGRVIAGPAGAPPAVDVPLRVAVVQGGIQEKTIATKVYHTTVPMTEASSVPFTLVAEELVYPVPLGAAGDSYVFYIGFDPQAAKPQAKGKTSKKK